MKKNLQFSLWACLLKSGRGKAAGFTLIELLVALLITAIIVPTLLWFVIDLLRSDREDFARSETQREMNLALDYISSELREAVYVYEGDCLNATGRTSSDARGYCPGLSKSTVISFSSGVSPILAFWKLEKLPYRNDSDSLSSTSTENFASNCSSLGSNSTTCEALKLKRNSYTLVIYSYSTANSGNIWKGPARLERFSLRQYVSTNLSTLTQTTGYVDPASSNLDATQNVTFQSWPCTVNGVCPGSAINYANNANVLVDYIDSSSSPSAQACPDAADYSQITPGSATGFYACVRKPAANNNSNDASADNTNINDTTQEVSVFLRGNAVSRVGGAANPNTNLYIPTLQTQVQTRGVLRRNPDELVQ